MYTVNGYKIKPRARLTGASLCRANLSGAILVEANLGRANLSETDLCRANLSGADLSGVTGLITAADWLAANFQSNEKGYIVYKTEGRGTYFTAPDAWKYSKYITEVPNPSRTCTCGCGVNFATKKWIKKEFNLKLKNNFVRIRRMYLHWRDLPDVVVPYNTNGKARCARLEKGRLLPKI